MINGHKAWPKSQNNVPNKTPLSKRQNWKPASRVGNHEFGCVLNVIFLSINDKKEKYEAKAVGRATLYSKWLNQIGHAINSR